jgi:hypothetical protein
MAIETDAPGIRLSGPGVKDGSPAKAETASVPTVPEEIVSPVLRICR